MTTAVPEPTPVPTPGPTAQPEVYLPVIEHGPTESKRIAVTVDDLNEVDNLNQIISIAESSKAKLTLFAIGKTVTEKSDLQVALRRAHNLGYELENHTYSPWFPPVLTAFPETTFPRGCLPAPVCARKTGSVPVRSRGW